MANLKSFGLENFRLFKNKIDFELAPITILTGTNNSGKSSLSKALLLLSDTLNKTKGDGFVFEPLNFQRNDIHHLGGLKFISNNEENDIKFTLNLDITENVKVESKNCKLELTFFNNSQNCIKGISLITKEGAEIIKTDTFYKEEYEDAFLTQKFNIQYLVDKLYINGDYDLHTPLLNASFYNSIGIDYNLQDPSILSQIERIALSDTFESTRLYFSYNDFLDDYFEASFYWGEWENNDITKNSFLPNLIHRLLDNGIMDLYFLEDYRKQAIKILKEHSLPFITIIHQTIIDLLNGLEQDDFKEYQNTTQVQSFKTIILDRILVENLNTCINMYCNIIYLPREKNQTKRIHSEVSNNNFLYTQIEDVLRFNNRFSYNSSSFSNKSGYKLDDYTSKRNNFF